MRFQHLRVSVSIEAERVTRRHVLSSRAEIGYVSVFLLGPGSRSSAAQHSQPKGDTGLQLTIQTAK